MIHVHDDATIAFLGSGAFERVRVLSLDVPFILGKAPHYVPAALKGTRPTYRSDEEIEAMHRFADAILYPTRAEQVMRPDDA